MLLSHPKVDDVGVIGITSVEKATELPRAYVVPSGGLSKLDDTARQALSKELTEWVAANVSRIRQKWRVAKADLDGHISGGQPQAIAGRLHTDRGDSEEVCIMP